MYRADPDVTPHGVGMHTETVEKIVRMFQAEIETNALFWGAQLAIYRHGKRVVDIGGGFARASDRKPIAPDSMFVLYSSTKGLAALCVHMLHERGGFSYDDTIGKYWPEFAHYGKETATIAHALGHRTPETDVIVTCKAASDVFVEDSALVCCYQVL